MITGITGIIHVTKNDGEAVLETPLAVAPKRRRLEMQAKSTPTPLTAEQEQRFWSYVDASTGPDSCWLWSGAIHHSGYGSVRFNRKQYQAHRVAWDLVNGPMPVEMFACHACDTPACCNPSHIWPGTAKQNTADSTAKGRRIYLSGVANPAHRHRDRLPRGDSHYTRLNPEKAVRGSRHGQAKLSDQQVREIRAEYDRGGGSQRVLASRHGVSQSLISLIVLRRNWDHVD